MIPPIDISQSPISFQYRHFAFVSLSLDGCFCVWKSGYGSNLRVGSRDDFIKVDIGHIRHSIESMLSPFYSLSNANQNSLEAPCR